jgi:hypothetical protein
MPDPLLDISEVPTVHTWRTYIVDLNQEPMLELELHGGRTFRVMMPAQTAQDRGTALRDLGARLLRPSASKIN